MAVVRGLRFQVKISFWLYCATEGPGSSLKSLALSLSNFQMWNQNIFLVLELYDLFQYNEQDAPDDDSGNEWMYRDQTACTVNRLSLSDDHSEKKHAVQRKC